MKLLHSQCPFNVCNIFQFCNELCRYFSRWEPEGFYIQVIDIKSKFLHQEAVQISSAHADVPALHAFQTASSRSWGSRRNTVAVGEKIQ